MSEEKETEEESWRKKRAIWEKRKDADMSEAERKRAFEATEVEKQRNMNYKFKEKQRK